MQLVISQSDAPQAEGWYWVRAKFAGGRAPEPARVVIRWPGAKAEVIWFNAYLSVDQFDFFGSLPAVVIGEQSEVQAQVQAIAGATPVEVPVQQAPAPAPVQVITVGPEPVQVDTIATAAEVPVPLPNVRDPVNG